MADDSDNGDKEHEPTQKKLDDARKKGEVPRSTDINTAAVYLGMLIAGSAVGANVLQGLGSTLKGIIAQSPALSRDVFDGGGAAFGGALMLEVGAKLTPFFALPAVLALGAIIVQQTFVVTPEKLLPKLNRISPLANAKNKFGRSGLFEFFKSFVKLSIYSTILGGFLWKKLPEMLGSIRLTPAQGTVILLELCLSFLTLVLVISALIGGVDILWQRQEHQRKNRMSRKEMMDEHKESEGDPHMKQQRRQRGYDIAMRRMLQDVPDADVVVVNPTHYAVALKWSRGKGAAPICVAKGVDEMAARIREVASEAGVPIHRDPPTARAIHASVEIGHEIHPDHYQAVAVAIRFAEEMRRRARARSVQLRDRS